MLSHLLDKVAYGPEIALILLVLWRLFKYFRPWIKTRAEMAKSREEAGTSREETGKSREATAKTILKVRRIAGRLLVIFLIACAVVVVALVLVALTVPQTSDWFSVVRLLAGIALGVFLFVSLLATGGLLIFDYVIELEDRCQQLEDRDRIRDERQKEIEKQVLLQNRLLEELFPGQQKLPFILGEQEEFPS